MCVYLCTCVFSYMWFLNDEGIGRTSRKYRDCVWEVLCLLVCAYVCLCVSVNVSVFVCVSVWKKEGIRLINRRK